MISIRDGTFGMRICALLLLLALIGCGGESSGDAVCPDECPDDCVAGECVEPVCARDGDCGADSKCQLGVCVARQPCDGVQCGRGVCEEATGECVNATACNDTLGNAECLRDFYCFEGACQTADVVCGSLTCERGVCDPADQRCVSKESCVDDVDCAMGSVCIDQKCGPNLCDECARGVCDVGLGTCLNPESCIETRDCLEGSACIDDVCDPNPCRACESNLICQVLISGQGVECREAISGCFDALGCLGDRICDNGRCGEASGCEADFSEPNDTVPTATVLPATSIWKKPASACPGDEDVYVIDYSGRTDPGIFAVDVGVDEVDEGRVWLLVQLIAQDGTVLAETSGWEPDPISITARTEPVYVRVKHDGDAQIGVDYVVSGAWMPGTNPETCGPIRDAFFFFDGSGYEGSPREGGALSCDASDGWGLATDTFEVDEWSRVEIEVSAGDFGALAIGEGCGVLSNELACAPNEEGTARVEKLLAPGEYNIVVSGRDSVFKRTITQTPVACPPFAARCFVGGREEVCRSDGSGYISRSCQMGCDPDGYGCLEPQSESCSSPRRLELPAAELVGWSKYQDDVQLGSDCGGEAISGGMLTDGPDAVYEVLLQPFDRLEVTLDPRGNLASVYSVEQCQDAASTCRAATAVSTDVKTLKLDNDDFVARDFLIVVDSVAGTSGESATVTMEKAVRVCAPGTAICQGNVAVQCIDGGFAEVATECLYGCQLGNCVVGGNDTCGQAGPLLSVSSHSELIGRFSNSYQFGAECGGDNTGGPDAVFDVTGAVGEVVNVELDATFDATLSVVTDCSSASTCVASDATVRTTSAQFLVEAGKQYFAIVDSRPGSTGAFEIRASSSVPNCTNDAPVCVDATTVRVCTELGRFIDYACDGTCRGGVCGEPRGTSCFDPVRAGLGATELLVPLDTSSFQNAGPGTRGACTLNVDDDGSDRFYEVELEPGDVLTAELLYSQTGSSISIQGNCTSAASCLAAAEDTGARENPSVQYAATVAETVYVVVDSAGTGPGSNARVSVDIDVERACVGSSATCAGDGFTLDYCVGGSAGQVECPGSCVNGACDDTSADSCFQAPIISSDSIIPVAPNDGSFTSLSLDRFGSCMVPFERLSHGPDSFYELALAAGETVSVTNMGFSARVYLFEDCADMGSCVAGAALQDETLSYRADAAKSVWLVVDSESNFTSHQNVHVQFDSGLTCAPNTWSCDAAGVKQCDLSGSKFVNDAQCPGGCDGEVCASVVAGDSCNSAPVVTGGMTRVDLRNWTDTMTASGCGIGPGPEYVQAIDLAARQMIRARVTDRQGRASSLAVVDSCGAAPAALVCKNGGRSYELEFVAPTAGRYFVVLEGTNPEEGFVDLEIQFAQTCPAPRSCMPDGATIEYCDAAGFRVQHTCSSGVCGADMCAMGDRQSCVEAELIGPGSYSVWMQGSNTFEFTTSACPITDSLGPDDYFAIDLTAGQTLEVSTSSFLDLYLVEDCRGGSSCLQTSVSNSNHTLTYVAPTTGRYYLVADALTDLQLGVNMQVSVTP